MGDLLQFAEVLGQFVRRSGYTSGQLSRLSGVPKPTIVNWLEGRVKKPRRVEDLVRLAQVLHLIQGELDLLFKAGGHPHLDQLKKTAVLTNNVPLIKLLKHFQPEKANIQSRPFQAVTGIPFFVGREAIIRQIEATLLSDQGPKYVSIQGMGGIGKTALANKLAHRLRHHFVDGVLWASLSSQDTLSILHSFAGVFGQDVNHLADVEVRAQVVRDLLVHKKILIILDDAATTVQIRPLLPHLSQGAAIWTTRHQDLSISRYALQIQLQPFDKALDESLTLFQEVLGAARVEAERPYFQELSDLLGHLPLAIDIAAARLAFEPGWSTQEFLNRIRQEKLRLQELVYDVQNVQLSIVSSLELLQDQLKTVFINLALFKQNDFSDTAVAYILDQPLAFIQDVLRKLYGLSLISAGRQRPGQGTRYQIHALVADYLQTFSINSSFVKRYVEYYFLLIQSRGHHIEILNDEHANLIQSLYLAEENKMSGLFLGLVNGLYRYWEATGQYKTAQTWLNKAILLINEGGDPEQQLETFVNQGRLFEKLGEYIEAETIYEKVLAAAREQKNDYQLSHILRRLGVMASRRSDYVLADAYYKEGIQLTRKLNQGNAVSDFLRGLGIQAYMDGRLSQAESFYEEGLALMPLTQSEIKSQRGEGSRIWGLGYLALQQGELEQAEAHFLKALTMAKKIDHLERVIVLSRSLAQLYQQSQQIEKARLILTDAISLAEEMGNKWQLARSLGELAELMLQNASISKAESTFRMQNNLARILNSQELVAESLFGLARIAKLNRDFSLAAHYGNQSLDGFISIGHTLVQTVRTWLSEL